MKPKLTTTIGTRGRYHAIGIGGKKLYLDDDQLRELARLIADSPVGTHADTR